MGFSAGDESESDSLLPDMVDDDLGILDKAYVVDIDKVEEKNTKCGVWIWV